MPEERLEGVWWLPERPRRQLRGTLTIQEDGRARLDLLDDWDTTAIGSKPPHPKRILGTAISGKNVTLEDCVRFRRASLIGGPRVATASYQPAVVLVGAHVKPAGAPITLTTVIARFTHLDEWANLPGIDVDEPTDLIAWTIRYKRPDPVPVYEGERFRVSLEAAVRGPSLSAVQKDIRLEQQAQFVIRAHTNLSLQDAFGAILHLRNFLTLVVGQPVHHTATLAQTRHAVSRPPGGKPRAELVQIHFEHDRAPSVARSFLPSQMVLDRSAMGDRLAAMFRRWVEREQALAPVYQLYFGTLYQPGMYLEQQFLSLAHGLESYHRRVMDRTELPKAEHRRRKREIVSAVPPGQRAWLIQKLGYSNEISLRERLEDLYALFPDLLGRLTGDRDAFVRSVADTRNYRTHFSPRLRQRATDGERLLDLVLVMRVWLEACLLRELGLDAPQVEQLLARRGTRRAPRARVTA